MLSSPHSGRIYQKLFLDLTGLSLEQMRASEDCYVDDLVETATRFGCTILQAHFPRVFVDLNRSFEDLDPKLIRDVDDKKTNKRIEAGLGVIPRVVGSGTEIYDKKLSKAEVNHRLRVFYFPYHLQLRKELAKIKRIFGYAILLDFHSMPHSSLQLFEKNSVDSPEIVLGDGYGTSCEPWLVDFLTRKFVMSGFKVAKNTPFSGGFITRKYGAPKNKLYAIQIEIDRSLYMDENNYSLKDDYLTFKAKLEKVIRSVSHVRHPDATHYDAAE